MKYYTIQKVFLCLSLLFLALLMGCQGKTHCNNRVQKILDQISLEDQKNLETFWRRVLKQDQFGFALFGSKAAATTGYFQRLPPGSIRVLPFEYMRRREFEAWEKHKSHFQSKNFIWVVGTNSQCNHLESITVVHREKFLQVVSQHLEFFQTYLERECTPAQLFEDLKDGNQDILLLLNKREDLLGILLGFGKEASCEYERREELMRAMHPSPPFREETTPWGFDTLKQEYDFLWTNLSARTDDGLEYSKNRHIFLFRPVLFMNLGSDEDENIIKKYRKDREKIAQLFLERNLLEVILEQIHAEKPICLEN